MAGDRNNQLTENAVEFRIDYLGGTNPIYIGRAVIPSATSAANWQIRKLAYDVNNNPTSQTFPQDANGNASVAYDFVWDSRATYTYS